MLSEPEHKSLLEHCTKFINSGDDEVTLRTQVPQYSDSLFTLLNRPSFDSLDEIVFAFESTRLTHETETFFSCNFSNGTARSDIPFENPE